MPPSATPRASGTSGDARAGAEEGQPAIAPIISTCRRGFELAAAVSWSSHDPFDFLLISGGDAVRARSALAGRALVQLGRRGGAPIRRVARVAPHQEAKAIADFLSAAVLVSSDPAGEWSEHYVGQLGHQLCGLALPTPHGCGWGLGFPYASRFVSVPARTPNAYTTISCVLALACAADKTGDERLLSTAQAGARAISFDLGIVRDGARRWFRYWPQNDACIVNVQALIAGCFARLGRMVGDPRLIDEAGLAAEITSAAQREDGSFPYSLDERGAFVDAFHTGFVLEGLSRFRSAGGELGASSVPRGLDYLQARLMAPSGLPRSSPDGPVAQDGQNVGQLVQTLAVCGDPAQMRRACEIWQAHAQPRPFRPAASLRWDIGPVVLAGAHLAGALSAQRGRT